VSPEKWRGGSRSKVEIQVRAHANASPASFEFNLGELNETLEDVSRINNVARRQYHRSGKPDDYPSLYDGEMYIDVEEDCVHECRSGL
jgi:hypothetical protein